MRRPITDFSAAIRALVLAAVPTAGQVDLYDGEVTLTVLRLRVAAWPAIFIGYRGSEGSEQGRRRLESLRFTITVCTKPAAYEPGLDTGTAAIIDAVLQALDGEILFAGGFPLICAPPFVRPEFRPPLYGIECTARQTYQAKN